MTVDGWSVGVRLRSVNFNRLVTVCSVWSITVSCRTVYRRWSVGVGDRMVGIRSLVVGRRSVRGGDWSVGIRLLVERRLVRGGDQTVSIWSSVIVSVVW